MREAGDGSKEVDLLDARCDLLLETSRERTKAISGLDQKGPGMRKE